MITNEKYECFRCGYNTKKRTNIKSHYNRKKICNPILEDVSIEILKNELEGKNSTFCHFLGAKTAPFSTLGLKNECIYCKKEFTRPSGLKKHLNICKYQVKQIEEKQNEKWEMEKNELKNKIEDLIVELSNVKSNMNKNMINTITNNITNNMTQNMTQNTTQNIMILNYGKENMDYIDTSYLSNLINGAFGAIPKLIKKIHYDPEHPENHNIKITNN